jgi:hypothetical protein
MRGARATELVAADKAFAVEALSEEDMDGIIGFSVFLYGQPLMGTPLD